MDREELARQTADAEAEAERERLARATEGDDGEAGSENGHDDLVDEGGIKSLIDQIADLRDEAKKDHHLDLPIPGTRNLLWARYRPFQSAKTERKTAQYRKQMERGGAVVLTAACDLLIDACEQIMVLPAHFQGDPGDQGENLTPIDDAIPVQYDSRLADLFIKNPQERAFIKTARQVVLAMFPTEQSVISTNITVTQWLNDVTKDADGELIRD